MLVDADRGLRARQLAALGARVVALATPEELVSLERELSADGPSGGVTVAPGTASRTGLATASADVVVGFWTCFRPNGEAELVEAERVLRPGGRLLAVQDYARDDLAAFFPVDRSRELVGWSRRDGWYATNGFRIHVVHAFWTFPNGGAMRDAVAGAFGSEAPGLLAGRHRPRLSWKVVVYHRTREGLDLPAGGPAAGSA